MGVLDDFFEPDNPETETQPTAEASAAAVLPEAVKNVIIGGMGGRVSDVVLVTQKTLTLIDLCPYIHDGMYMNFPDHQMYSPPFCLTEDELDRVDYGGMIKVGLIEPCLEISEVFLSKSSDFYHIGHNYNWCFVIERNSNIMREGTLINLWSFRSSSSILCFAIVPVQHHPN